MNVLKSREIVIEYERLQLIRKRARTQVVVCAACGAESDFVPMSDAADLFNTPKDVISAFVAERRCHVETDMSGVVYVCIGSLLGELRDRIDTSENQPLLGEAN